MSNAATKRMAGDALSEYGDILTCFGINFEEK